MRPCKRMCVLLLSAFVLLYLAACTGTPDSKEESGTGSIPTTQTENATTVTDETIVSTGTEEMTTNTMTNTPSTSVITTSRPSTTVAPTTTAVPEKKAVMRVLFIGDSNTENGYITAGLRDKIKAAYGDCGSGYDTINPYSGYNNRQCSTTVEHDAGWYEFDMQRGGAGSSDPGPYYSPDGNALTSSVKGARTTITFIGNGVDVYYPTAPQRGQITVALDDGVPQTVEQNGEVALHRLRLDAGAYGRHSVTIVNNGASPVELSGIDIFGGETSNALRSVVDVWGNAAASSKDYAKTERKTTVDAVKWLMPTHVVILLGTNDYNAVQTFPDKFEANILEIISRVREGAPNAKITVASTCNIQYDENNPFKLNYLAESFPNIRDKAGVHYFDLNSWFGAYDSSKYMDWGHVNKEWGRKIGEQFYLEIQK